MSPEYAFWSEHESARANHCKPGVPYTAYLGARGRFSWQGLYTRWADAHCRRPRKKILSHNFVRSESWPLSRGLKMVRRKPKVALSTLLEIRKWANNCPLRVEKDTRNRLLGHPKSPSRRVNTLFGAPLRLLAPPSAGARAGCSELHTPRGGPGDGSTSFFQSSPPPPSS